MASIETSDQSNSHGDKVAAAATHDLERQLKQVREDISALAKSVASIGAGKAESYRDKVERVTDRATDASREALEELRAGAQALEGRVSAEVRESPLRALGVAAAIGFAAALLARR